MAGPEARIERRVARDAKERLGVLSWKLAHVANETGVPDRLFLVPGGRPLLIEFKAPGQPLRPKQAWWAETLTTLGYATLRADDYETAMAAIEAALREARGV